MYEQCIGFCAKRALGRHRSCSYCRERAESSHSKGFLKGKLQEKYVAACSRMQPHAAACSSMQQHEKYPRDSTWCFLSRVYWGRSDQIMRPLVRGALMAALTRRFAHFLPQWGRIHWGRSDQIMRPLVRGALMAALTRIFAHFLPQWSRIHWGRSDQIMRPLVREALMAALLCS